MKKKIGTYFLASVLLLFFLSPRFVLAGSVLGVGTSSPQGWDIDSITGFGLPESSNGISGILLNIFYWLLLMFGIAGVAGFVISGFMYIMSRGDETAMKTAKKAMTYSAYGIVVGLSGVVVIMAVENLLGGKTTF